jgi:hypothetical protein
MAISGANIFDATDVDCGEEGDDTLEVNSGLTCRPVVSKIVVIESIGSELAASSMQDIEDAVCQVA